MCIADDDVEMTTFDSLMLTVWYWHSTWNLCWRLMWWHSVMVINLLLMICWWLVFVDDDDINVDVGVVVIDIVAPMCGYYYCGAISVMLFYWLEWYYWWKLMMYSLSCWCCRRWRKIGIDDVVEVMVFRVCSIYW
jgi:hypothetical protein